MDGVSPKMQIFYAMTCYPAVKANVERVIEQLSEVSEIDTLCTYSDWVGRHGLIQDLIEKVQTLPFAKEVSEKIFTYFKIAVA